MGCGQGLTTFSWIWLLDTEMLREACPGERGEVEVRGPWAQDIFTHMNLFAQLENGDDNRCSPLGPVEKTTR